MCSKSRTCVRNAYVNIRTSARFSTGKTEKKREICVLKICARLDILSTFSAICIAGGTANVITAISSFNLETKMSRMITIYYFPTLQKRMYYTSHVMITLTWNIGGLRQSYQNNGLWSSLIISAEKKWDSYMRSSPDGCFGFYLSRHENT